MDTLNSFTSVYKENIVYKYHNHKIIDTKKTWNGELKGFLDIKPEEKKLILNTSDYYTQQSIREEAKRRPEYYRLNKKGS